MPSYDDPFAHSSRLPACVFAALVSLTLAIGMLL
jgi:hypothetical protein